MAVVVGINLPMVIYGLTHRDQGLEEAAEGCARVAREGIRRTA